MIIDRISKLRQLMQERYIDTYIIPTSDYHESEYVGEYFNTRKYMSGFTGSAGILIVTMTEACLLTDGRYFIQAQSQLENTGIELFRSGEKGVPNIVELINEKTPQNGLAAFDGKVVNAKLGIALGKFLERKAIQVKYDEDLIDIIWSERPQLEFTNLFHLEEKYTGKSTKQKLTEVKMKISELNAQYHILSSLDDIAWLFNFRANDIEHNPVALAYSIISDKETLLFINKSSLSDEVLNNLISADVQLYEYDYIYEYIRINKNIFNHVLIELGKINYAIYKLIGIETVIIDQINPTTLLKAIKNEVEIKNIKSAHVKDGVAVTKFLYWLKTNIGKKNITELSATKQLYDLRQMQDGFLDLSFATIAAYKEHAAMMHYSATQESDVVLRPEGMLLVDSGGHYFEGSTDITRTIVLGEVTEQMKLHYTLVVKSMLRLANATFLYGCNGQNLDILARGPMWDHLIDYKCGTGHGIGYLLNVHESPNGFRWKSVPERNDVCVFEPGMITTDEPGIYIEGSYGIRVENELLCVEKVENEYGKFLTFESITLAPIDLDGINVKYLEPSDIKALNLYHELVYNKISPYLSDEEKEWLRFYTRELNNI